MPTPLLAATDPDAPAAGIVDVRAESAFAASHHPSAASLPLEDMDARSHELPRRDCPLQVCDIDPARRRVGVVELIRRGFEDVNEFDMRRRDPWVAGPALVRLWQPGALVVEARGLIESARRTEGGGGESDAKPLLLDLACGSGRDAVWLGLCGWRIEGWDVLPDALQRFKDLAARHGVPAAAREVDLTTCAAPPEPTHDVVCVSHYLERSLFPFIRAAVRPGGWVVYETFVDPQRLRHGKPRREAFELRRGELPSEFDGWEIAAYREGEFLPRRITARLIARKPRQV
jgi:SAM-dependent methyltransferase